MVEQLFVPLPQNTEVLCLPVFLCLLNQSTRSNRRLPSFCAQPSQSYRFVAFLVQPLALHSVQINVVVLCGNRSPSTPLISSAEKWRHAKALRQALHTWWLICNFTPMPFATPWMQLFIALSRRSVRRLRWPIGGHISVFVPQRIQPLRFDVVECEIFLPRVQCLLHCILNL